MTRSHPPVGLLLPAVLLCLVSAAGMAVAAAENLEAHNLADAKELAATHGSPILLETYSFN